MEPSYARMSEDGVSPPSDESQFKLKKANIGYMVLFIAVGFLSLLLNNTGDKWLGHVIKTSYTAADAVQLSLVCRTTMASAVFFAIHGLAMIGNKNLSHSCQFIIHVSWAFCHFLVFLAIYIAFWFIPDGLFDAYKQFAYGAAGLYLIMQLLFLIDFFYGLNEKYAAGDDDDNHYCKLLAVTVGLAVVAIGGFIASYVCFHGHGGLALGIISVNLGVCIVLFLASLLIEHGSIFTASLVIAYVSFLTFSGCLSRWKLSDSSFAHAVTIGLAIVFALITLSSIAYSAFSSNLQFAVLLSCDAEETEKPFSLSCFHMIFAFASVYLTMLVTNWGGSDDRVWSMDTGSVASWVNFGASWLSLVLYAWTLVAPLVCTSRDFS